MYKKLLFLLVLFCAAVNAQWVQTAYRGSAYCFAVSPATGGAGSTNLFAGTVNGVVLTTNNGTSWTTVNAGLPNRPVGSLAVIGANLFAGTAGAGVFLSTNNGTNWTPTILSGASVQSFAVIGTNLFAGTAGGSVFLSTNNGTSWAQVDSGLTSASINSLAVSLTGTAGTNLFAATDSGVYVRPLSEMFTGVKNKQNNFPTSFSLQQNYPNPFNPTTMINYSVPKTSLVTIKVYDILGKEIATLVNEEKSAGNYSVQFSANGGYASGRNGGNLSSGIYFYRMQSGNYSQTKKLVLLK